MAYVSQEKKAKLAVAIKTILKKYGVKATLGVRHHSTLVLNIKSSKIDFLGNFNEVCKQSLKADRDYLEVNPYWFQDHFSGVAKEFLAEITQAMYGPDYYDESDPQTDYFNCSHYIRVNIGKWDKPYVLEQ